LPGNTGIRTAASVVGTSARRAREARRRPSRAEQNRERIGGVSYTTASIVRIAAETYLKKPMRKRLVTAKQLLMHNNVALASYPRSGNTWLGKLIEELSGSRTGSIYDEYVFPRPWCGIVIKTHKTDGKRYSRFVHLVRNPFDAISSHFDHQQAFSRECGCTWDAHVRGGVLAWKRHTAYWLAMPCPHVTLRYEDLISNPICELKRLGQFLGLANSDEEIEHAIAACTIERLREQCRSQGSDADSFFRHGKVGHDTDRFSDEQVRYFSDEISELMRRFEYEVPLRRISA